MKSDIFPEWPPFSKNAARRTPHLSRRERFWRTPPTKPLQNADLSFSMFRVFWGFFINMSCERISTKPLQNADSICPYFSREKRENQRTTPPYAKTNATKPPVRPILPANPRTPHKILERLQHPARRPDRSPLQEQCTWPKKFCTVWVHKYYIGPNGAGQNFW